MDIDDPETISLWLRAFLLTLLFEIPVFVLFVRGRVPMLRAALAGAAGTCVTHPLLWLVWPYLNPDHYASNLTVAEVLIAIVETLTFFALARPVKLGRAAAASFSANAFSAGVGLFIYWLLG